MLKIKLPSVVLLTLALSQVGYTADDLAPSKNVCGSANDVESILVA